MQLYKIKQQLDEAMQDATFEAVEREGEVSDILIDKIEALELEHDEKVSNIACMIKNIDSESSALKNEKKSIDARIKQKDSTVSSLKTYLSTWMKGEKFEDHRCAVSWRKSKSVIITDELVLSCRYITEVVTKKIDKKMIKLEIDGGCNVEGAKVVENQNIQIK